MANLFLVEDHDSMRRTLAAMLEKEEDFRITGLAASGEEALALLADAAPDLLLIDISLPGMHGLKLLEKVQALQPGLPCLILSGHAESVYGKQAQIAGAIGYIDKRNVREIVPAIRRALADVAGG